MAAPTTTTWELEPHTRAKHEILRRYLAAWTPILSHAGFREIVYVDGFAGPGGYSTGEDGSPLIALKTALQQRTPIETHVYFLFVERDADRAAELRQRVAAIALPENFKTQVVDGSSFEDAFREHVLDYYKRRRRAVPPTFAFIDPFGWTGIPFSLIRELLTNPSCEVLVNFMYEEINRFIQHPDQSKNFDELFGTVDWRGIAGITGTKARRDFLHGLYVGQLQSAGGARYVRSFEMRNERDVTDYFLCFATNNRRGMARMKEAMWKVDRSGEFSFSDATNPSQALLFEQQPNFNDLKMRIIGQFAGKVISVSEIEEFVLARTPFRETHYKRHVLTELEKSGAIVAVAPPPNRKVGTYADSAMLLRFTGRAP